MNTIKDKQGNNILVIYSEEIEAVTLSSKAKKVRVYCRPTGYFEFRLKKKALVSDKYLRFEEDLPG
jgi:hypothetical protein